MILHCFARVYISYKQVDLKACFFFFFVFIKRVHTAASGFALIKLRTREIYLMLARWATTWTYT